MYEIKKKVGGNITTKNCGDLKSAMQDIALYLERYNVHASLTLKGPKHKDAWDRDVDSPAEKMAFGDAGEVADEAPDKSKASPTKRGRSTPAAQKSQKKGRARKSDAHAEADAVSELTAGAEDGGQES